MSTSGYLDEEGFDNILVNEVRGTEVSVHKADRTTGSVYADLPVACFNVCTGDIGEHIVGMQLIDTYPRATL